MNSKLKEIWLANDGKISIDKSRFSFYTFSSVLLIKKFCQA